MLDSCFGVAGSSLSRKIRIVVFYISLMEESYIIIKVYFKTHSKSSFPILEISVLDHSNTLVVSMTHKDYEAKGHF